MTDLNSNFIYILNSKIIVKIKENKYNCIPLNTDIKIDTLINKDLLLYMKYTKSTTKTGFVGHLNIVNIINNTDEKYDILCNYYALHNINNLYFISYEKIDYFDNIYTLALVNKNYQKSIKIPSGMNFYDIHSLKINMIKLINDLIINDNNEKIIITDDTKKKLNEKIIIIDDINKKIDDNITLQIPILHIPCDVFNNILLKKEFNYEIINEHYKNCKNCEITNNNNLHLELNNNINYKIISDTNELAKIIYHYGHSYRYSESLQIFNSYKYDLDKINLIYCDTIGEIYDKCLFFIA